MWFPNIRTLGCPLRWVVPHVPPSSLDLGWRTCSVTHGHSPTPTRARSERRSVRQWTTTPPQDPSSLVDTFLKSSHLLHPYFLWSFRLVPLPTRTPTLRLELGPIRTLWARDRGTHRRQRTPGPEVPRPRTEKWTSSIPVKLWGYTVPGRVCTSTDRRWETERSKVVGQNPSGRERQRDTHRVELDREERFKVEDVSKSLILLEWFRCTWY